MSHITSGAGGKTLLTTGLGEQFNLSRNGNEMRRELAAGSAIDDPPTRKCSDALASAGWDRAVGLLQQQCVSVASNGESDLWYSSIEREGGFNLRENPAGKGGSVLGFATGSEVGNATVRFFGIDGRGWIWRGSPVGIYVADPELARQGQWLYLSRTDGIAGTDANRGSFFSDPDGSVWFCLDDPINGSQVSGLNEQVVDTVQDERGKGTKGDSPER
jgi:hypothetical protein